MNRDDLIRRLRPYGQIELANAVIVPAGAAWFASSYDTVSVGAILAFAPASALLVLGGRYWLAIVARLDGKGDRRLRAVLEAADRFERPFLVGTAVVIAATVWAWLPSSDVSAGSRSALLAASLLAVLEYVNYFHRQLQHFDHLPDFRRLRKGQGFRRAHLARDLAAHRAGR